MGVWRYLSCRVRVGGLGDDLGLPGFDEDDGGDQDDQYRYEESDNDWLYGRVSDALLGCRVAWYGLLLVHGLIGCRSSGWG